jgi:thiamine transport system substrate-binding protein
VLTYESLVGEGALGPELRSRFEKKCGCRVQFEVAGDATQMLSKLQMERVRGKPRTQVALGIDQTLWSEARALALPWMPKAKWVHQVSEGFVPFDFGVMALMWNPTWKGFQGKKVEPPRSWKDLARPEWSKRFVLQDPRTSTPGLGWVMGAGEVFGAQATQYFHELRGQWLTLAPGWSASYGLFLKEQAPLVWSYTTSQAYHRKNEPLSKYEAVLFDEGNPLQIEGALVVKDAVQDSAARQLAQSFVEFLVSSEVQALIPERQWMFPAVEGVTLPLEFKTLPVPKKILKLPARSVRDVIRNWEKWIR